MNKEERKEILMSLLEECGEMELKNNYPVTEDELIDYPVNGSFAFGYLCGALKRMEKFDGVDMIAAERQRQIEVHGYDSEHDKEYPSIEFVQAAVTYLILALRANDMNLRGDSKAVETLKLIGIGAWPWNECTLKPSLDFKRNIVKGLALGAAALDRINMDE